MQLSQEAVLDLSSVGCDGPSSFQAVFGEMLRRHGLCEGFELLSSTSAATRLWIKRQPRDGNDQLIVEGAALEDVAADEEMRLARVSFSDIGALSKFEHPECALLFRRPSDLLADNISFVERCFRRSYMLMLTSFRSRLRTNVIVRCLRSKDLNSLVNRAIFDVILPDLQVEAASIFVFDPRNRFLRLAGTSGLSTPLTRKDIFYRPDENHTILQCCKKSRVLKERDITGRLNRGKYWEETNGERMYSRSYYPLVLQDYNKFEGEFLDGYGAMRVVNAYSLGPDGQKLRRFPTWEDDYLFVFVAELIAVFANFYMRARTSEWEIETTVHGFRADLEGSLQNMEAIRNVLFGNYEAGIEPRVRVEYPDPNFTVGAVQTLFDDGIIFLDDLSFQIEKTTGRLAEGSEKDRITTQEWFHDVLMPVVNLADPTARIHGRQAVRINKLKDELKPLERGGFEGLPVVHGSSDALLSVLRNFLENAIKYCKRDRQPEVHIGFQITDDFVYIRFLDCGIGIPAEEGKFLFTEGFRGEEAKRRSNRGTGIGLSYCRDLMRSYDGDVRFERSREGTLFVVDLKRVSGIKAS